MFDPQVGKIPWRRERLLTPVFWPGEFHVLYILEVTKSRTGLNDFHFHFQCTLSILSRQGNGNPFQYFCLENPMDGEAWWAAVHGVAKSRTLLIHFTFTFHFGEGNGNPLPCSCLENPRDGGAWWAAIYGVTQSRTRLK